MGGENQNDDDGKTVMTPEQQEEIKNMYTQAGGKWRDQAWVGKSATALELQVSTPITFVSATSLCVGKQC